MRVNSINAKIGLAVSAIVAVLIVAMVLTMLSYFENVYKAAIAQEEFLLAESIARDIDDKLDTAHEALLAVSKTVTPDMVADAGKAQEFLDAHNALVSIFDNHIYLFNLSGTIIAEAPHQPDRRGMDYSFREYFQTTLKTKRPHIGDPYLSSQGHHHPAVMLTAPVYDANGQMIAIMAGGFDLMKENFLGELPQARIGKTGYYYMYNTNRVMIIHSDPERMMKQDVPPGANALFDKAIEGFEGSGETVNSRGIPVLSSFKHLKKTNWILVANHPLDELHAPLTQARRAVVIAIPLGVMLVILVVWYVVGHVTRPLVMLTSHVEVLHAKTGDARFVQIGSHDEIGALSQAFNEMLGQLDQKTASLEKSNEELVRLASTDALTGAWNRRRFEEVAEVEMERARRYGQPLSLILFDLDNFKQINDRYGHQIGDSVLRELSQMVRENIRESDSFTRWGGDEFMVLAPNLAINQALELAEKLKTLVLGHRFHDVDKITLSLGVSQFITNDNLDIWIKRVDDALYAAKSAGRNNVVVNA